MLPNPLFGIFLRKINADQLFRLSIKPCGDDDVF
jgi:hypothetical protein